MDKICIKGDETLETGKKIISYLESLGGINENFLKGDASSYYYIDIDGIIYNPDSIPNRSTVVDINNLPPIKQELTFPRVMMVSDLPITEENIGKRRVVWAYNDNLPYPYIAYGYIIQSLEDIYKVDIQERQGSWWRYAQDIKEPIILELTLEEIAAKFNVSVDNIKIKK